MKRWKLLVVFVSLFINLLPALAAALQGDPLSGVQWHLQKPSEQIWPNEHQGASQNVQKAPDNGKDYPSRFEIHLIGILHAMADQEKTAHEQDRADNKPWGSPSMWINLGLLIVGAIYTYAAWGQWKVTEGALRETKRSVDFAVEMERPWIQVIPEDPPRDWMKIKDGEIPLTFLKWTAANIGRSPAFLMRLHIGVEALGLPIDKVPPYKEAPLFAKFPLPPNGVYKGHFPVSIPQSEIASIVAGKKCVAFFGFIVYCDAGNQEHRTRFFSYWTYNVLGWTFSASGPPDTVEYT